MPSMALLVLASAQYEWNSTVSIQMERGKKLGEWMRILQALLVQSPNLPDYHSNEQVILMDYVRKAKEVFLCLVYIVLLS